jgi:serine O-acetyltransferase
MIKSRKDYEYYLESDRLALGRSELSYMNSFISYIYPDYIWKFQKQLRKLEYLHNVKCSGFCNNIIYYYNRYKFRELSLKLGFSIPINVFGPGLSIVHYGTIIVNVNAIVGSNCRIHADTNIGASGGSDKAPIIGENVYIAPGVKIFGDIKIPSNTALGANAVVNRSFQDEGTMIAGVPAKVIGRIDIKKIIKHI